MHRHVQLSDVLLSSGQILGKDQRQEHRFLFEHDNSSSSSSSVIFIPGDGAKQFKDHTLDPQAIPSPIPLEYWSSLTIRREQTTRSFLL